MFRFEAMWIRELGCECIVHDTWVLSSGRSTMEEFMPRIGDCGQRLQAWNCMDFGNVQIQLKQAKDHLQLLQDCDPMGLSKEDQNYAREEVHKWLERDEVMWR